MKSEDRTSALVDRAAAMAAKARASVASETSEEAREWYTVALLDRDEFELFLCPPQTLSWVQALYPEGGVIPISH